MSTVKSFIPSALMDFPNKLIAILAALTMVYFALEYIVLCIIENVASALSAARDMTIRLFLPGYCNTHWDYAFKPGIATECIHLRDNANVQMRIGILLCLVWGLMLYVVTCLILKSIRGGVDASRGDREFVEKLVKENSEKTLECMAVLKKFEETHCTLLELLPNLQVGGNEQIFNNLASIQATITEMAEQQKQAAAVRKARLTLEEAKRRRESQEGALRRWEDGEGSFLGSSVNSDHSKSLANSVSSNASSQGTKPVKGILKNSNGKKDGEWW